MHLGTVVSALCAFNLLVLCGCARQDAPPTGSYQVEQQYQKAIVDELLKHAVPLPGSDADELSGVVYIKFTLAPSGNVTEVTIDRSSGHKELDDFMLNAVDT
jgi:hypothetical protein